MDKPWKSHFREPVAGLAGKSFTTMASMSTDTEYANKVLQQAASSYEEARVKFVELAKFPNRETLYKMLADLANAGRIMGVAEATYAPFDAQNGNPAVRVANDHVQKLMADIVASFHPEDSNSTSA